MRILAIVFAICFALSAALQYNDPDPAVWISVYGLAAVASLLFLKGKLPALVYLVLALAYFTAAFFQWPPEFEGFLFGEIQTMRNMNIELARESAGLGIVAIAMLIFWIATPKKQS